MIMRQMFIHLFFFICRDMVRKHGNKQGTRNATKKRNKYGKVERVNLTHEW